MWKTVLVQDGEESGDPVILKDVWAVPHRRREGGFYEDFRGADHAPELRPHVDRSLLTVLCHGDVFLDTDRTVSDCTRSFDINNLTNIDDSLRQSRSVGSEDLPPTTNRKA